MTSSSLAIRIQDLPFNKDVQPLVIQDPLVQKFQKTMKQYPPGTEIDIFKQDPNHWRCQNMWNGCKKLGQLCISSTQYDACTAYVHTIGIKMPITSPPDDAIISFWQPDQLNRIWVLPASKCNWEKYDPKTWHAVMFSSVHQSFTDAPAGRPMPIETDPLDPTDAPQQPDTQQPPDQPDHPMPDPRPPTPPDENMSDPPPDPPHQPDHPMPPAPRSVSPDSPVDPPLPPHDKPGGGDAALKRQKQSISSSSGLNRLGVMSLCRHSRNHLSQFFRLLRYLHHLRFLQIPKQKNKMKILNCQHLRKKKQPAVHQRSRRRRRRRSQMTMMSHLVQSFGRPLYSEQQKEPHHDEPDYDLPTTSIPPSPHPSRSEAPHEDEGSAQPKHRMRRPAPPSIEEERKIKPFAKKPITFMFHATYGNQLVSIMEHGLKSGKSQSNP